MSAQLAQGKIPNLARIATQDLVQTIGSDNFSADYINWARTVQLLRDHAPDWMPEAVKTPTGSLLHKAPTGAYLLLRFRHIDGTLTPEVPQAVMDHRNASIPLAKITARDVTDTHRRGVCMAAAFTFGLAYELWAKMPLEGAYQSEGSGEPSAAQREAVRKIEHDAAYGRHSESIVFIKERIAAEDWKAVAEEWNAIPQADQMALWIAPSKGGCLTTAERKAIKEQLPRVSA